MARASQDVVGFRRIFVLYCTLVLLPAILMSGFAVVAIRNERQAEKQRVRERAESQLQVAEAAFVSLVDSIDRQVRDAFTAKTVAELERTAIAARAAGTPLGPWVYLDGNGLPLAGEPPLLTAGKLKLNKHMRSTIASLDEMDVAHLSASGLGDEDKDAVLAVVGLQGGHSIAFVIENDAFDARLESQVILDEPFVFVHRVTTADEEISPLRALSDLMREVIPRDGEDVEIAASGLADVVSTHLKPPFDRSTLVISAPPTGTAATVVYVILLLVFISVLITGVVITSRLIWRETKISRMKTDFVSHVSHELRTPLTSIRMFIETLRLGRATSKEEEQECLDLLSRETERLSGMIERVLGYARLQAGRRQFQISAEPVDRVVADALDAFHAQTMGEVGSQHLDLITDIPSDLPLVLVDKTALSEALLNLVGNAFKYTGVDKRIRIFARKRRRRVIIGVEDNGPGLPKSEHKRVFDRFYQAGNLLSRKSEGSGLGLAITRGIIEGQGGKIGVSSENGKGCTFLVELKIAS